MSAADDSWKHQAVLESPKSMLPLGLGSTVAVSDDRWIAVGAGSDHDLGVDAGAVAIWRSGATGIQFVTTLEHPKESQSSGFGNALAFDSASGVLVIGAPNEPGPGEWPDNFQMGRVFVYELHPQLKLAAILDPPDPSVGAHFGAALAASGGRIVVGSPNQNGAAFALGRVDVFVERAGTWIFESRLIAPNEAQGMRFGSSIAICDETIIVGSPQFNGVVAGGGRADLFAFTHGNWEHSDSLHSPAPEHSAMFAAAVALWNDPLEGEMIAIGAPGETPFRSAAFPDHAGVVHLYERSRTQEIHGSWTHAETITSPQPWCGRAQFRPEAFGMSLSAHGGWIAVGASEACNPAAASAEHQDGEGSGAVYLFHASDAEDVRTDSSWKFTARLTAPIASPEVHDGYRVALAGGAFPLLVVGRLGDPDAPPGPSAVNIYSPRASSTRPSP